MISVSNFKKNPVSILSSITYLALTCLLLAIVIAACAIVFFYVYSLKMNAFGLLNIVLYMLIIIELALTGWLTIVLFQVRKKPKDDAVDKRIDLKNKKAGTKAYPRNYFNVISKINRKNKSNIHELPWYLVMGAKSSGKTAALSSCGYREMTGAKGNVASDILNVSKYQFWQAHDAFLIEATQNYTGQEIVPKKAWSELIRYLRKARRGEFLNGIILTVSIAELLHDQEDERELNLNFIQQQLSELTSSLKVRIPVYIVLTKADLLMGFEAFFSDFTPTEREQVFGITLPGQYDIGSNYLMSNSCNENFILLQKRIDYLLIGKMQQETDPTNRGKAFHFIAELAALKKPIQNLVTKLGSNPTSNVNPLLRGIYFTSVIDAEEHDAKLRRNQRSYFFRPLLQKLIFNEAALVLQDRYLVQRRRKNRFSLIAAIVIVISIITIYGRSTFIQTQQAIARAQSQLNSYEKLSSDISIRNINDDDILRILPSIENVKNIGDTLKNSVSILAHTSQYDDLNQLQKTAYQNALNQMLLPRLLEYLQSELDQQQSPNSRFDTLKLYSMLGGLGAIDKDFAIAQAQRIFGLLYPGEGRSAIRLALTQHVTDLLNNQLPPINTDPIRIAKARKEVQALSVEERAFYILTSQWGALDLPNWALATALGPVASEAFERKSGASLQSGVSGIFTVAGYRQVKKSLANAIRVAFSEQWVHGEVADSKQLTFDILSQSVMQQYFQIFSKTWETTLQDIKIRSSSTLLEASQIAHILATTPTPIETLSKSISTETDLSDQTLVDFSTPVVIQPPDLYADLRTALHSKDATSNEGTETQAQARTFFTLLPQQLQNISDQLSLLSTSTSEISHIFDVESSFYKANEALVNAARNAPSPINIWLGEMAAHNANYAIRAARDEISSEWSAAAGPYCDVTLDRRYPFDRKADAEITLSDFVALFGPKGLFQQFFDQKLKPFVDTSHTPWQWRSTFGSPQPMSQALRQFQYAEMIKRAFFPFGQSTPSVDFTLTPVALSSTASAVILEMEGQRAVYFHGPKQPKSIIWPSQQKMPFSRLIFQPDGWENALTKNGFWSPFRLLDQGQIIDETDGRLRLRFSKSNNYADFDVQFGSIFDPFRLPALREFQCPLQF